jgi:DSBA-like thioredoxin domain-containing protein
VVERDVQDAKGLGVSGTPTFFIDGKKVVGALDIAALKQQIDQAMLEPGPAIGRKNQAKDIDAITGQLTQRCKMESSRIKSNKISMATGRGRC